MNNPKIIEDFRIEDFDSIYYNKNLVIEASAGTGKTTNIKWIVKKLVGKGINPQELLIVTYTEKAAGELKDRIRTELKGIVSNDDLDNLNIYTIHSFCQNAIKEFGLEAGKPLDLDVIDEKAMVGDFFDRFVREDDEIKSDIDKVFRLKIGIKKDGSFSFYVTSGDKENDNSNNLKKAFTSVVLLYYLKDDGAPDDEIIKLKDVKLPLVDYYFKDDPVEAVLKNSEFKSYYDSINGSDCKDLKAKMLVDTVLRIIKARSIGKQNASVNYKKYDSWDITDDEKASIKYFMDLYDISNKTNEIDYPYNSFDSLLKNESVFSKCYNTLLNSRDIRCKYYSDYLLKNSKYISKVYRVKFFASVGFKPDKNNLWPKAGLRSAVDYFNKVLNSFDKEVVASFFIKKYIKKFYLAWQKEKELNKWQTFNDMLRTIREILLAENKKDDKPLTMALRNKYKYAIIDEFQDTNRIQFDTFKLIFMQDDSHHIIVVGDPKQSIYSFQGADLNVYNIAKKEIIDNNGVIARLKINYRSSEKMIKGCNIMFDDDFFKISDDKEYIEFSPSDPPEVDKVDLLKNDVSDKAIWVAMRDLSKGEPKDAKASNDEKASNDAIDKKETKKGKEEKPVDNRAISSDDYAKLIVNTIVECCKDDNFFIVDKEGKKRHPRFNDFAILARSRSEMYPVVRELKKSGIPYVKYKDNGLFNSRECANFIAILEAINTIDFTGYNRKKYHKALFTDFFKKSLEEINTEYFNHDDGFEVDCFKKWKALLKKGKWEDLIDDIIFGSHLYNNLKSLDKLQSLSIYKQLGDYAISYLYNNHSLYDLINRLKNTTSDDEDEDSGIIEIGTDFNCVKIMTIHASKGLQYPIVISLAGFKDKKSVMVYTFHDLNDDGNRRITFDSEDSKLDAKEEWLRLLYVCFTRAENLLILPYYKDSNFYNDELSKRMKKFIDGTEKEYKPIYVTGSVSETINDDVKDILNKTSNTLENTDTVDLKKLVGKVYGLRINKHSYSSISHPEKEEDESFDDEDTDDKERNNKSDLNLKEFDNQSKQVDTYLVDTECIPYDDIPKGNKIGSAMHEVFERIDFVSTKEDDKLKSIIDQRLKANNVLSNEKIKGYIAGMVTNVLGATLPVIKGTSAKEGSFKLKEISKENKKSEMEFNFTFEKSRLKNYCNGFIDLLFSRGDYYSILDWKSDALSDDFKSYCNKESLKDHTDEHYSIQRVLYSYCLIKWLNDKYNEESLEYTFNNHFGGVYYVYLRGCIENTGNGIYAQTWNSFSDLEEAYHKILGRIGVKDNE